MKKHRPQTPSSAGKATKTRQQVPPSPRREMMDQPDNYITETEEAGNWLRFGILTKLGILLVTIIVITVLWFSGLEVSYARIVVGTTNATLSMGGRETRLEVEKQDDTYLFRVHTRIEGRAGSYPQAFGPLLLPSVMVIAWQIFMLFFMRRKQWLLSSLINMGCFFAVQVIFLLLLSAYYTSQAASYVYDMMMDSFYIIALLIILLDNIRHPVFLSHLKLK